MATKGQLISKCLFDVFTFFQKMNVNKSTSSEVEFVRSFFGRNVGLKKSFRICLTFITAGPLLFCIDLRCWGAGTNTNDLVAAQEDEHPHVKT